MRVTVRLPFCVGVENARWRDIRARATRRRRLPRTTTAIASDAVRGGNVAAFAVFAARRMGDAEARARRREDDDGGGDDVARGCASDAAAAPDGDGGRGVVVDVRELEKDALRRRFTSSVGACGADEGAIVDAGLKTTSRRPLAVVVHEVTYEVRKRGDAHARVRLLDDVSAVFPPGKISALMGPSGAGKTTLLDVVSGRKTQGYLRGRVVVGDEPASKAALKTCAAYVEQFDCLLPSLTVRETLMYQAQLKGGPDVSAKEREAHVERLLDDLRLRSCADVIVGSALSRGVSGGQAKRVNIGISLVTQPRVLFLDEPTSGLDSKTSYDLMRVIRKFADEDGVAVIATIHSPSSEAFRQFDRLLMLKGGRVTYAGPLFGEEGAETYFYSLGYFFDPNDNFADFLISTAADDAADFPREFAQSFHHKRNRDEVRKYIKDVVHRKSIGDTSSSLSSAIAEAPARSSFVNAVWTLLKYRTSRNYRNAQFVGARCAGHLIFAVVMATMYWNQGKSMSLASQINVSNMLFMNNVLPAFAAGAYLPSILMERPLLYRELDDGCYPLLAYITYKVIEEAIAAFVVSLLATTIVYNAVGLVGNFAVDWLTYFGVQQCGAAIAYACAAVARDVDAANAILPVYNVLQILFAGLLLHAEDVPRGWSFWPPTLFVRYGWQAQMLNHFKRAEPSVFLDADGALEGVTGYYDIRGSVQGNVLFLYLLWIAWLALATIVTATVRHQQR